MRYTHRKDASELQNFRTLLQLILKRVQERGKREAKWEQRKMSRVCVLVLLVWAMTLMMAQGFHVSKLSPSILKRQQFLSMVSIPPPGLQELTTTESMALTSSSPSPSTSLPPAIGSSYPQTQYELSPQQFIYVILTTIFVTCLIVADVIGVKLFEIPLPFEILGHKTVEHTCGMLTFPITFLLGDIINEYYGPKASKNTVYLGLGASILVFLTMNFAQAMPFLDKPFNVTPEAFNMIFGSAKLMYVASVCAYLIGSLSDIWLFGVIKNLT